MSIVESWLMGLCTNGDKEPMMRAEFQESSGDTSVD